LRFRRGHFGRVLAMPIIESFAALLRHGNLLIGGRNQSWRMSWMQDFLSPSQFLRASRCWGVRLIPSLCRVRQNSSLSWASDGSVLRRYNTLRRPIWPVHLWHCLYLFFLYSLRAGFTKMGLADTADGFGRRVDREQVLAILRDSRIGSLRALALVLSLYCQILAPLSSL